jgi:hypothetical protein
MMQSTMGRRYQIDYAFGLRYVFSPAYRAKLRNSWGQSTGMRLLYMIGSLIRHSCCDIGIAIPGACDTGTGTLITENPQLQL